MATPGSSEPDADSAVGEEVQPKDAQEVDDASAVGDEVQPKDAQEVDDASAVGEELLPKSVGRINSRQKSPCDPCETYFGVLAPSVESRLVAKLRGAPEAGGIDMQGALQQQAPLTMDVVGQLQTTKEHWRWDNCRASLGSKGLYEAPDPFFGFPCYRQAGKAKFSQLRSSRMA